MIPKPDGLTGTNYSRDGDGRKAPFTTVGDREWEDEDEEFQNRFALHPVVIV